MSYQRSLTPQRGFTALELIIVLIIGFSIIGLSASKMSEMMNSSKAIRALDSIISVSTAIRELKSFDGYGPVNADLTATLFDSGKTPKSLRIGQNNTLLNQWNQPISITVAADIHNFVITYPGVPKAACNQLVKNLLSDLSVSIAPATVAVAAGTQGPSGPPPTGVPVQQNANTQDLVKACNVTAPVTLILTEW